MGYIPPPSPVMQGPTKRKPVMITVSQPIQIIEDDYHCENCLAYVQGICTTPDLRMLAEDGGCVGFVAKAPPKRL